MIETYKYQCEGVEMPSEVAIQMDSYEKLIYIDNELKKREFFHDGKLDYLFYYLGSETLNSDLIEEYSALNYPVGFWKSLDAPDGCELSEIFEYTGAVLTEHAKCGGTNNGMCVDQRYDVDSGAVVFTQKTLNNPAFRETYWLFEYDQKGELQFATDMDPDGGMFIPSDFTNPDIISWSWEGIEYFKNAYPLLPGMTE